MGGELVEVGAWHAAVVRRECAWSGLAEAIQSAMQVDVSALRRELQAGHNVFVYRPRPGGRVVLGCGFQVAGPFEPPAGSEVVCEAVSAGRAARAVHVGPYQELRRAWEPLLAWIEAQGLSSSGVQWELYGDWEEDPARLRTEVFVQVSPG